MSTPLALVPKGGFVITTSAFSLSQQARGVFVLAANSDGKVGPVAFHPISLQHVRSHFYVRSNLTFLDEVIVHGIGGSGELVLSGSTEVDGKRVLRFALSEHSLLQAEKELLEMAATPEVKPPSRAPTAPPRNRL